MPVELTTNGIEEGTYVVTATFTDEDGNSVVPNNINWWLYDSSNNIVNGRSNIAIAIPAASIDIVLQGDDLAIIGRDNRRVMRIEYDYDSSYGTGLPGKAEVEFDITDLETYIGTAETIITLTVNTNTWITLIEANTYFSGKYGTEAWETLPNETRKRLLISAYKWINRLPDYTISTITQNLKDAQGELAWYIYTYNDTHKKHQDLYASGVRDFRISKFTEKLDKPQLPDIVQDLLDEYNMNAGGYFPLVDREVEQNQ